MNLSFSAAQAVPAAMTAGNREQPVIHAPRLTLRPLRRQDRDQLQLFTSDRRLAEGTRSIPHPLPADAAASFIEAARAPDREEDVWALDGSLRGSATLMGVISLKALDRGQSQIGYWVAPAFWNTGLASEAVRALIEANPHASRTLFAEVFQDNPVSARILTNAGFEYIGDAEAMSLARGQAVPTWTYLRRMD
ncbi:MAG: acetyltransferase [Rhodobacteraceae bacterium HLUCCA12]|nr:MAG: acetyltransferase [Rhodobacteraceae bacterium HLUCCA12]